MKVKFNDGSELEVLYTLLEGDQFILVVVKTGEKTKCCIVNKNQLYEEFKME